MLTYTIGSVATFLAIELIAIWQILEILYDSKSKARRGLSIRVFAWGLILGLELVGFVNP